MQNYTFSIICANLFNIFSDDFYPIIVNLNTRDVIFPHYYRRAKGIANRLVNSAIVQDFVT